MNRAEVRARVISFREALEAEAKARSAEAMRTRKCAIDGKPVPPRRAYLCSEECKAEWWRRYDYTASSKVVSAFRKKLVAENPAPHKEVERWRKVKVRKPWSCDFCRLPVPKGKQVWSYTIAPWDEDGSGCWGRIILHFECCKLLFEEFGEDGMPDTGPADYLSDLFDLDIQLDGTCGLGHPMGHTVEQVFEHKAGLADEGTMKVLNEWYDFYRSAKGVS